ncbi:probable G-protein coupled receptor CG31760 [Actinia tenebrosa]|uniref:Probable G-protein coupled receptor CG31760 n=1 Tax=Actinia tenebrosa TaxID=6105 RepID=A0A6P8HZF1_ACTTE|nr:probable G-protein coupled receptor CG31760 [Actinia tenebrosa]
MYINKAYKILIATLLVLRYAVDAKVEDRENTDSASHLFDPMDSNGDPSVVNPSRPQIEDTRPSVFGMTAREALRIIDKIRLEDSDCEKMLETRSMEVLRIKYENTVYNRQAEIAIRTANLVTDILPTGSTKSLPGQPSKSVLLSNNDILYSIVRNNVESDSLIFGSAVIFNNYPNFGTWYAPYAYGNLNDPFIKVKDLSTTWSYLHELFVNFVKAKSLGRPFPQRTTYFFPRYNKTSDKPQVNLTHFFVESLDGLWTRPYYECTTSRAWQITYTAPIIGNWTSGAKPSFMGVTTIDIELTNVDINQCDRDSGGPFQFEVFIGTHRCKNFTTMCVHTKGLGFQAGSYKCVCRPGFYFPVNFARKNWFNGSEVEKLAQDNRSIYYTNPDSFECLPCREGCVTCVDDSPCVVTLNWPLRYALTSITIVAVLIALGTVGVVIFYREIKVIKSASPQFLCIILLGSILMYLEIVVLFPQAEELLCIVRLWLRHLGFGLAYTSLLLKTWRIAVIFRVKSAQKIRLTDRHLLTRLAPILAVYLVYLLAWSLAASNRVLEHKDTQDRKFYECAVDWWDHAILIFEVLFLLWGIRLCYNVRKAPSAFNESKFISWSIYNMFVVTFFLKIARLFITSVAGPDMNYLIEFFRVQFTVSVLIGLVFIPKIFRIIKGRGDMFDTSGKIASIKGAALNMKNMTSGISSEGTVNIAQENDDLKAEIRKLYSQLEQIKTSNMEAGNRHLSKSTSNIYDTSASFSSLGTSYANPNATPRRSRRNQRLSPAAELASDYV